METFHLNVDPKDEFQGMNVSGIDNMHYIR
jgi:hypothetical protein